MVLALRRFRAAWSVLRGEDRGAEERVGDEDDESAETFVHRHTVGELYVRGRLWLYFDLGIRAGRKGQTYGLKAVVLPVEFWPKLRSTDHLRWRDANADREQMPMLFDLPQGVQLGEGRAVPSVVWLQEFDELEGLVSDPVEPPVVRGFLDGRACRPRDEPLLRLPQSDRELMRFGDRDLPVFQDQLPDDVVQAGAEVVDDFARDDSALEHVEVGLQVTDILAALRISLADDVIGIRFVPKLKDFTVERLQMFDRTVHAGMYQR